MRHAHAFVGPARLQFDLRFIDGPWCKHTLGRCAHERVVFNIGRCVGPGSFDLARFRPRRSGRWLSWRKGLVPPGAGEPVALKAGRKTPTAAGLTAHGQAQIDGMR